MQAYILRSLNPASSSPTLPMRAHTTQIVGEADQLYGVAHTNRVSRVYTIQREDALTFLQVSLARGGS